MKLKLLLLILAPTLLSFTANAQDSSCKIYQEVDGRLVIEAESADLSNTNWEYRNAENPGYLGSFQDGHSGEGYIEYSGPDSFREPKDKAISYTFKIENPGTYYLIWRSWKNHTHDPQKDDPEKFEDDRNNDAFIKMEGDFEADTKYFRQAGNNKYHGAPLTALRKYTKFIGGGNGDKGWNRTLNLEPSTHNFKSPVYKLKAGEAYTLHVVGRSFQFAVDRIYLFRMYDESGNDEVDYTYEYRQFRGAVSNGHYEVSPCAQAITSVSPNSEGPSFQVFPNPTQGRIRVKELPSTATSYTLTNVSGTEVLAGETQEALELDLTALPAGLYYLHVSAGEERMSQKVVKW